MCSVLSECKGRNRLSYIPELRAHLPVIHSHSYPLHYTRALPASLYQPHSCLVRQVDHQLALGHSQQEYSVCQLAFIICLCIPALILHLRYRDHLCYFCMCQLRFFTKQLSGFSAKLPCGCTEFRWKQLRSESLQPAPSEPAPPPIAGCLRISYDRTGRGVFCRLLRTLDSYMGATCGCRNHIQSGP